LKDHQSFVPVNWWKGRHSVPYHSSPCGLRSEEPAKENVRHLFSCTVYLLNRSCQRQSKFGLSKEDEVATEIRDTLHAIIASLADSSASCPNQAQPSSSVKGKDKESVTGAGSTPPSQNATSKDVVRSFGLVEGIEAAFENMNNDFHFPSQLDFISTHLRDVGDGLVKGTSRLAFSARNHPVRYYEQALTSLLSRLDSIDSFGNEALRTRRKKVVRRVETALDELERGIEASHKIASDALTRERKMEEAQVSRPLSDSMTKGTFPGVNATGSSPIVFDKVATEKEDVISPSNTETISTPSDILITDPEGGSSPSAVSAPEMSHSRDDEQEEEINTSSPPSGEEVVADAHTISDVPFEAATTDPEGGSSPSAASASEMSHSSDDEQEEEINTSQPPSGKEVVADAHAILDVPIEAAVPIVPTVLNDGSAAELEDVSAFLLTNVTDAPQSQGPLPSHSTDDLGSDWSDVEEEQS
jgi:hypothetical protein